MKLTLPKLLLLSLSFCFNAHAEIRFVGVLSSPKTSLYGLTDTSTGTSSWVAIGRSFSGIEIIAYDAESKALTIRIENKTSKLQLQAPSIGTDAVSNQPLTEADQFKLAYKLALAGNEKIADLLVRYEEASSDIPNRLLEAKKVADADPTNQAKADVVKQLTADMTSPNTTLLFLKQQILREVAKASAPAVKS